jgi:hypothetical protein
MRNKMNKLFLIVFLILISFSTILVSDVLIIDRIQNSQSVNVPQRSITMNQVISEFGEPILKKGPIGEPPITVWKYDNFSVYFEKSWVINSVINKSSPNEKGPKPIE